MGSLYIGGAQCVHAQFKDENDWRQYDSQEKELEKLAAQFNLSISRYCLDEEDYSFVLMNKPAKHECFYSGAAFNYDMSVEVSDTFDSRAKEFINALNFNNAFTTFHNLEWSTHSEVLYFTVS